MNVRNKELFALFDADECIYNPVYRFLILKVRNEYGNQIAQLLAGKKPNTSQIQSLTKDIMVMLSDMVEFNDDLTIFKIIGFSPKKLKELELGLLRSLDWRGEDFDRILETLKSKSSANKNDNSQDDSSEQSESEFSESTEQLMDDCISEEIYSFLAKLDRLGDSGKDIYKSILLAANQQLFTDIVIRLKSENFNHLTVMSVSNRQFDEDDIRNAKKNGTALFKRDMAYICEIFNNLLDAKIDEKCSYDDFSMQNVHGNKISVWDERKFTLYFAILNHISKHYQDSDNVVAAYDDRLDIIKAIVDKFIQDLSLIPSDLTLELCPYNGAYISDLSANQKNGCVFVMDGKGKGYTNYPEIVKALVQHCHAEKDDNKGKSKSALQPGQYYNIDAASLEVQVIKSIINKNEKVTSLVKSKATMFSAASSEGGSQESDAVSVVTVNYIESQSMSRDSSNMSVNSVIIKSPSNENVTPVSEKKKQIVVPTELKVTYRNGEKKQDESVAVNGATNGVKKQADVADTVGEDCRCKCTIL